MAECKHVHTVYDEQQGATYCARCGAWVLLNDGTLRATEGGDDA